VDGLPFSQACENNKQAILACIQPLLQDREDVLEIGSGTGQHAVYFAAAMPWLSWRPSELDAQLPVLLPRCETYTGTNLAAPAALDVSARPWSMPVPEAMYTANTLHIMPWGAVEALFDWLAGNAPANFLLLVYGPFNYDGQYTSDSNARFDEWLKDRDPDSGIRDFDAVDELARRAGLGLAADEAMPANNRLLTWRSR
jgi:hypothetical protein